MSTREIATSRGPLKAILASGIGFVLGFVLGGVVLLLIWFGAFFKGMTESVGSNVAGLLNVTADYDAVSSTFEPGAFALLFGCGLGGAVIGCAVRIVTARRKESA